MKAIPREEFKIANIYYDCENEELQTLLKLEKIDDNRLYFKALSECRANYLTDKDGLISFYKKGSDFYEKE